MKNKKKNKYTFRFLVLIIFLICVISGNFVVAYSTGNSQSNSNMRVELTDTVFLRPGFDVSKSVPETRSGEWFAGNGQPKSLKYSRLSKNETQDVTLNDLKVLFENTAEFTVTRIVDISAEQKRYFDTKTDILGLNINKPTGVEEIYLNGRLLHKEKPAKKFFVFSVISIRSSPHFQIPVEKNLLNKGKNYLTFCVKYFPDTISVFNEESFSAGGSYFEDYKILSNPRDDIITLIMVGIFLFAGIYAVNTYAGMRKQRCNIWFGFASIFMAILSFLTVSLMKLDFSVVFTIFAICLCAMIWCLGIFVNKISSEKLTVMTKIFTVISAVSVLIFIDPLDMYTVVGIGIYLLVLIAYLLYAFTCLIIPAIIRKVKSFHKTNGLSVGNAIFNVFLNTILGNLVISFIVIVVCLCIGRFSLNMFTRYGFLFFVLIMTNRFSSNIEQLYDEVEEKNIVLASNNKRLEIAVKERTKKLEEQTQIAVEANKSKSAFLAMMSHEIRTPMNSIIGVAEIELMNENLPAQLTNSLTRIQTSGHSLLGIINDLLDFSKIESGKLEINPIHYDIPSLINDSVQLNIIRIGSKPIKFLIDVDPQLYANLYGDELRLKQILNNILSNAFKYTDEGMVTLGVSCKRDGDKVSLIFKVTDTGQGMSPENVEMLFEEYSRFNEAKNHSTEGTGLGMSITNRLVHMMNGNIDVESELGVGSVFTVTLEQGYSDDTVIGEELAEKLRSFEYNETRRQRANVVYSNMSYGRVLIVDDVETNIFVAEGLMSPYKLKIETAMSGFEAIDLVKGGKCYDIIFMDHMMPKMDGIETTVKLRSSGYYQPIVALTANAVAGNDKMFKGNGFDDFISKPIDVRQLNAVLNKFVRNRHKGEIAESAEVTEAETVKVDVNEKLMEVFRRDAAKAVVTLRETVQNGDLLLFATTAHAMKSACANIGENELSSFAKELELAGKSGDFDFINANTENFVLRLSAFVKTENDVEVENIEENDLLLREKLSAIKSAAEEFDDSAVSKILSELKMLKWKNNTLKLFEKIDELLLHSDFDEIGEAIGEWGY